MINEREKLERHIEFFPAFDKRNPDPKKDYGIGAARLLIYVKGIHGAYQFQMSTPWHLPGALTKNKGYLDQGKFPTVHTTFEGDVVCEEYERSCIWGADYHSYIPRYEGQTAISGCKILEGKPCYMDGSSLYGTNVFGKLVAGGSEAVFEELEKLYFERLAKSDAL